MKEVVKDTTKYLNDFQFEIRVSGGVEVILHNINAMLNKRHEDGSLAMLTVHL